MNGLIFAAPYSLWALLALPALWWLLRLTPPRPKLELFPPLRLLSALQMQETQAAQSPWWLTALRLLLAALLIFAFARPMQNRDMPILAAGGNFIIMLDNSWAAQAHKEQITAQAQRLIAAAEAKNSPVYIIATAAAPDAETGPYSGLEAKRLIDRLSFAALSPRRDLAFARLIKLAAQNKTAGSLTLAYLTDGLATTADKEAFANLQNLPIASLLWYQPQAANFIGITAAENSADGLHFTLIRTEQDKEQIWAGRIKAYDEKAQILGEQNFNFAKGAATIRDKFTLPPEIRNDIAFIRLETGKDSLTQRVNTTNAAGLRLLDTGNKQKTVAVLAPQQSRLAQPLLSPLYYAAKALEGAPQVAGGKVLQADTGTQEQNIDRLLNARPSLLIMGDTAAIPPAAQQKLRQWVEQGGTLLRFAGAALANADHNAAGDTAQMAKTLLPVPLRRGERSFGGALSWEKPQKLAPFPPNSPFYGMAAPQDISIFRQILAEPSADLLDKSWISLTDGTPLMTAASLGKGRLIFIHTGLDSGWSSLALSGFFVDMLRHLVALSGGETQAAPLPPAARFAPYRIITAEGALEAAPDTVRALILQNGKAPPPDFYTPPGFYGAHNALYPLNLLNENSRFAVLQKPALPALRAMDYAKRETEWQDRLFIAAACLFIADTLISLLLKTGFGGLPFGQGGAAAAGAGLAARLRQARRDFASGGGLKALGKGKNLLLFCACFGLAFAFNASPPAQARAPQAKAAQDSRPDGAEAAALAGKTRLAYVITGNSELDAVSKAGLQNLSRFIERRTTIEPGDVVGINPATDELAFYPIIYWPLDAAAPMPAQKAINAIDAYMRRGGTVLFDTRDALQNGLQLDSAAAGANTGRLRAILAGLNVPPLIPAPHEHVIARSFYIMPDFPGRYRNSPLWIAASSDAAGTSGDSSPIRAGDGVSPILITANDLAAAWADDGKGGFLFPLIPDGEEQRLWAFRGGLNIVMYILTGNYKADQMHAPELLRRLSP